MTGPVDEMMERNKKRVVINARVDEVIRAAAANGENQQMLDLLNTVFRPTEQLFAARFMNGEKDEGLPRSEQLLQAWCKYAAAHIYQMAATIQPENSTPIVASIFALIEGNVNSIIQNKASIDDTESLTVQ